MVRPLMRDEEGLSTFWSFVGVLVLVFVMLAVYFGVIVPRFPPPAARALPGDTVTVDYVGSFENGLVFDTSLASVATDNASRPKAFAFSWRNSWQPLPIRSVGSGEVVKGFDQGIQGLAVGDSKTLTVPPEQAYGPADPTKIQVKPLLESVPVRVTMNASAFRSTYGTDPVSGTAVKDPLWGWDATVDVAESFVTVTNSPTPGDLVHPRGAWDARVLSIDSGADNGVGRVEVRHLLDAGSADRVGGRSSSGSVEFVVTAVDLEAGTYTVNFNNPVLGRTLVFQVTMVHIGRSF
jgi:FKBP-type peptidyl-prolyl cis-trans isomerase 2